MAFNAPDLGSSAGITAYAQGRTTAADAYILKLGTLATQLNPPTINAEFPIPDGAPPITLPPVPAFAQIVWTAPAMPAPFVGSLDVTDIMPAPFDDEPPVMSFPAAPAPLTGDIPDAPGVVFDFDMPELVTSIPAPPNLLSLNISKFDGLNIPTFDEGELPTLTAVAPSVREYVPGSQYTSALLSAAQEHLRKAIVDGGTGLNPDVEEALWNRGREREYRTQADAIRELEKMETLGYSLPPGVYLDARIKITTETQNVMAGLSREVMIKAAELEQENVKVALTSAIQLEQSLLNYTNSVEQRAFDSCKYATEAGIAIYNAKVQAYTAFVDAYKTKVAIYEARIRAEAARVDAYRALVAAEQAKADVNRSLVEQYKVMSEVSLSSIEIFKAQIGAIQTRAEIEKTKVAIYGEQVRGYTAKVNAFTAGVEGFRAQIGAESTKQEAYKAQVQAYTARVEAAAKVSEVQIEAFKAKIAAKGAELDGYKAAIAGESERVKGLAMNNSAIADSYKAQVTGVASFNETLTKQWQVALDQAERVSEIAINTAKANAELYMTSRSILTDAAKVGAQVSAQLGAAALGAINWSTSSSFSQSFSQSQAESHSTSESQSLNKNYNYSVTNG